jgi:hypothetical protein
MSFRPARFADIQRCGPPTTKNGIEWVVPISAQPPDDWLRYFKPEGGDVAVAVEWILSVQSIQLRFRSSPDDLPHNVQSIDRCIGKANEQYRDWLLEAHRQGDERRRGEKTEADRIRNLNQQFRDL